MFHCCWKNRLTFLFCSAAHFYIPCLDENSVVTTCCLLQLPSHIPGGSVLPRGTLSTTRFHVHLHDTDLFKILGTWQKSVTFARVWNVKLRMDPWVKHCPPPPQSQGIHAHVHRYSGSLQSPRYQKAAATVCMHGEHSYAFADMLQISNTWQRLAAPLRTIFKLT